MRFLIIIALFALNIPVFAGSSCDIDAIYPSQSTPEEDKIKVKYDLSYSDCTPSSLPGKVLSANGTLILTNINTGQLLDTVSMTAGQNKITYLHANMHFEVPYRVSLVVRYVIREPGSHGGIDVDDVYQDSASFEIDRPY